MDTKLQQANAWGRVFALLSTPEKLPPTTMEIALQNPKAALAHALRGKFPADDTALAEAINQIDAGITFAPMNNDEQGEFWIGYYHQRATLEATPKKGGRQRKGEGVDWKSIAWERHTNAEIARQTGTAPQTVATQRKRYAPK